jgi:hypothetical protein
MSRPHNRLRPCMIDNTQALAVVPPPSMGSVTPSWSLRSRLHWQSWQRYGRRTGTDGYGRERDVQGISGALVLLHSKNKPPSSLMDQCSKQALPYAIPRALLCSSCSLPALLNLEQRLLESTSSQLLPLSSIVLSVLLLLLHTHRATSLPLPQASRPARRRGSWPSSSSQTSSCQRRGSCQQAVLRSKWMTSTHSWPR